MSSRGKGEPCGPRLAREKKEASSRAGTKGAAVRWANGPQGGSALAERSRNAKNIAATDEVVPCSPVGAPTPAECARERAAEISTRNTRSRNSPGRFSPGTVPTKVRYKGITRTLVRARPFPSLEPEDEVPEADDGMLLVPDSKLSQLGVEAIKAAILPAD